MHKALAVAAASALVLSQASAQEYAPAAPSAPVPYQAYRSVLSESDAGWLRQALAAARAGSRDRFAAAATNIVDADARKLATWALVDAAGEQLPFYELDRARTELADWPRAGRRQMLAEKALSGASLTAKQVVDWFGGREPTTAEGAMTLASALVIQNREPEARDLIRRFWRERSFEAEPQSSMLIRFGGWLTAEDHIKRLDTLLMGPQGPACQAIIALVPPDYQALASARMALRAGRPDALDLAMTLPDSVRGDPGLAFEQARWLRSKDRITEGYALLARWPKAPGHDDGDARLYSEARQYYVSALRARNWQAAYDAMAGRGFAGGERKAEAEFFAGWVALTKLNRPDLAARHFAGVAEAGRTPITQGRANYWLGRAYEAQNQIETAQIYYRAGAQHIGAFYGQLAAEKAGYRTITLPPEPQPSHIDREAFEGRDVVRAIRILSSLGEDGLFRAFVSHLDDNLASAVDYALLMDLVRGEGQPFTAMMVGRAAAGKGFILPERMYPVIATPQLSNAPDPAFILAITRQESSFDPRARSPADARGMMMLMPATARIVARQMGVPYDVGRLYDADYNMQLGSYHLGDLLGDFAGSYIMTAAGYNAGPGRPARWIGDCGDPRSSFTDPVDFIECVPFTETRDYIMRVMENMQVYRARLAGGTGPLTLSQDLKRGAAAYAAAQPEAALGAPPQP